MSEEYGLGVTTGLTFERAVVRTRIALRSEGFSILSEMPLPPEVGGEVGRRHLFLGLWQRILSSGNLGGPFLDVGDHLQCNVVVFEEGEETHVAVLDPAEGLEGWEEAELPRLAQGALERVLSVVATSRELP